MPTNVEIKARVRDLPALRAGISGTFYFSAGFRTQSPN